MSILGPRGRHRAQGKLSASFNSTARVSATVAVAGGLVASIAAPQAAQATTGVASISGASSATFAAQATRAHVIANPLTVTHAQQQLVTVRADAQLAPAVQAARYVKPVVRPAVSSVSRGATRTAPTSTTPPATNPAPPTTTPAPPTVGGIVGIAERFIGTPYVYGGSAPGGFDCSGFTAYVFRIAGISIPRTATAQMLSSTRVSNPQPGDLVFYGSSSYAYHVGIYLGNGMMIDANHPGGSVGIRPLYSGVVGYGRF